jgi:hypothetical protein
MLCKRATSGDFCCLPRHARERQGNIREHLTPSLELGRHRSCRLHGAHDAAPRPRHAASETVSDRQRRCRRASEQVCLSLGRLALVVSSEAARYLSPRRERRRNGLH